MKNLGINQEVIENLGKTVVIRGKEKQLTGKPSIDRVWDLYYPEEALKQEVPAKTMYRYIVDKNKNNHDSKISCMDITVSYGEAFNKIDEVAKAFVAQGVQKGDVVALCLPNILETVYCIYGLNKIGAIGSLMEPRTNAKRIQGYVNDTKANLMVTIDKCHDNIEKVLDGSCLKKVISISSANLLDDKNIMKKIYPIISPNKVGEGFMDWNDFIEEGQKISELKEQPYVPHSPAMIVYTGGTTGVPKGAELSNETYNAQNMQMAYSGINPEKEEKFLGNIPFFSAYGSSAGLHNALSSGVNIVLIPKYKPKDFPKLVVKNRTAHNIGVPNFWEIFVHKKWVLKKNNDWSFMKNPISGGDSMTKAQEEKINAILKEHNCPTGLKKGLGMSEFGGGITTTISDDTNSLGSVGVPLLQNNIKVVDPQTNEELSYNEVGELWATGPSCMNGYYNNPEETDKFFHTDENGVRWAKTGDLVYIGEDGQVYFEDRIKRAIMRPDGHTVTLLPIENAILQHKDVSSVAVVGVEPSIEHTGRLPMAFVVSENKNTPKLKDELEQLCEENLPDRERPFHYVFVEKLPYTLLGKVNFVKLEEMGKEEVELGKIKVEDTSSSMKKTYQKVKTMFGFRTKEEK